METYFSSNYRLCFYTGAYISEFGMIIWICPHWVGVSFFSGYFGECDDCVLPVYLACSADVLAGNACWYWRLGYWDYLGEGRLREKVFVVIRMMSERKGRLQ